MKKQENTKKVTIEDLETIDGGAPSIWPADREGIWPDRDGD